MKIQKTIAALLAVTAIDTIAVQAQTETQVLFKAQINVTCKPSLGNGKDKMKNRDFIRLCVGDGFTKKELDNNFQLVFNPAADSLQVVNTADGTLVCDVFEFQGGTNVLGNSQLQRLVFVFVPGNSDAVGSAFITERVSKNSNGNRRAKISGKIQFSMPESTGGGSNNVSVSSVTFSNSATGNVVTSDITGNFIESVPILATASEVQICSGTFTISKVFVPGVSVQLTNRQRRQLQQQQQQQNQTTETSTNLLSNITNNVSNTNLTGIITNLTGSITNLGNTTMLNALGL